MASPWGVTELVKRSFEPSADQTGPDAPPSSEVRARASPPSTGRTHTCGPFPPRVDTKATRLPSGDHAGWLLEPCADVMNGRGSPPATGTDQISVRERYVDRS